MENKKVIGEVGVDAGILWIGDPCYILHKNEPPKAIGKTWLEFCDNLSQRESGKRFAQFEYDRGHDGLGVCVSTGGDGYFPIVGVFDENDNLKSVTIQIS